MTRPKKPACASAQHLLQAGQIELVLDRAGFEPARLRGLEQRAAFGERGRDRLFAVDVLAGGDRLAQRRDALAGRRSVEEHCKVRPGQRRIEIGAPVVDAVAPRDAGQPLAVAPDQQQTRHDAVVANGQPALGADRRQRIGQMLRRPDAPGSAVDDDADVLERHGLLLPPGIV